VRGVAPSVAAATLLGLGRVPRCPGTVASLVGLGIGLAVMPYRWLHVGLCVVAVVGGAAVCARAEAALGVRDDPRIVVDEVAGMLVALLALPRSAAYVGGAFLVFRLLDVLKPRPVRLCERVGGGWGVMLDDLAAGLMTCAGGHLAALAVRTVM